MTTLRRLAATLLRSAVATLPPDRRPWGAAMLAELEQVPGDLRAVRWALGGVRAAGHVRRAAIARVAPVPVRLLLAAHAVSAVLATAVLVFVAMNYHQLVSTTDPDDATGYGLGVMLGLVWALPAVLAVSAGAALLAASWRRRAGVGPGWLTRPAAAAAETAVVVASLAVWALWFVPVGPDGQWMTAADIARNAAGGATMVCLPWLVPVALLEVRRRRLRRPDDTG
jgi:hypothetical protein